MYEFQVNSFIFWNDIQFLFKNFVWTKVSHTITYIYIDTMQWKLFSELRGEPIFLDKTFQDLPRDAPRNAVPLF